MLFDHVAMLLCPLCKASLEDGATRCPHDGRRPLAASVIESAGDDPMLGSTIADRYVIVGVLGSGGMGTVYRAEQQGFGRQVALKLLRADLGLNPTTAARFQREARTLSQLTSRNTVTVFDFGQTPEGRLFLVMELLEGEMLSQRIKREGRLSVAEAIRIAIGILRSLDEAHASGVVHRDLKPDNIFLQNSRVASADPSDPVKVVDFGIAKVQPSGEPLDSLKTQEGTVFGTPRYMAPEQAQGRAIDGRADLYAVGLLLFQMLAGRPPFTDDDAVLVMAHHIRTIPPIIRSVAADQPIPAALEALVQRALAKDPANRPQTAAEFLSLLEGLKAEAAMLPAPLAPIAPATPAGPISTAPATTVARSAPSRALERRRWIPAALFAALGLASLAVGLRANGPKPPQGPPPVRPATSAVRPAIAPAIQVPTRSPAATAPRAIPTEPAAQSGTQSTAQDAGASVAATSGLSPDAGVASTLPIENSVGARPPQRPSVLTARPPRRPQRAVTTPAVQAAEPAHREPSVPVARWDD